MADAKPAAQTDPAPSAPTGEAVLDVRDLHTWFHLPEGTARAVDGVSFRVARGETLGIVGESGCGKSVTALSVMRLVPSPPGRIESGSIRFQGRELLELPEKQMREIRGNGIGMIFQEPMTALNPVYTVGAQVAEVYRLHEGLSRAEAWNRAVAMLDSVRIPAPAERAKDYPHQLSGGMRQRAMIAMALACDPDVLIADEPTTALDVTVQAQILDLMAELQERTGAAVLMITHDLGVVAEIADRVDVMYAGLVVEEASADALFEQPAHPYTEGLIASLPSLEEAERGQELNAIKGTVPSPVEWPEGCRFSPRCPYAQEKCRLEAPRLEALCPGHLVRCFFPRNAS